MNALILTVALFTQPEFGPGYPVRQEFKQPPPAFRESFGQDVTVWTMQGCAPCVAMKSVVGPGDGVTRVRYVEGTPPAGVPQSFPVATWTDSAGKIRYLNGYHTLAQLSWSISQAESAIARTKQVQAFAVSSGPAEASPTPYAEIIRVLSLLPKPERGFVDYGCGADARWCILAVEKWGCKATGIEIDPARAMAARERVKAAGLEDRITILQGDAVDTDVDADVFCVYLYQDVLTKLQPKLSKMKAGASYMHAIPNMPATKNGDTFIYNRAAMATTQPRMAEWGGQLYSSPWCSAPGCRMCAEIRRQLGIQ